MSLKTTSHASDRAQVAGRHVAKKSALVEHGSSGTNTAIPVAVHQLIKQAELCEHFAGELNGDRSERDSEMNAQLQKNNCGAVPVQIKAPKVRHKNDPSIVKLLQKYE